MKYLADEVEPIRTFLDAPYQPDPSNVNTPYAFIGVPFGPPYHATDLTLCAGGADVVRQESFRQSDALNWNNYDFDIGGALFPDNVCTVTDMGTLPNDFRNPDKIWDTGIETFSTLVDQGIVPLVVGGFDAIPPMVGAAFRNETINVLQIDSHLDFRHERYGETRGFSSPIRRLREFPWVKEIVQVGLRAAGSARPSDVQDALDAGNRLITAWELHDMGPDALLSSLPKNGRWLITVDCDGLDTSIAPAVGARELGGLTYHEIRTIISTLSRENKVAALVFTEYQPDRDIQNITAQTIERLMINVIGNQRTPKVELPL